MEKSISNPRKSNVNLKHLPLPINPRIGNHGAYEKSINKWNVREFVPTNSLQEMKPIPISMSMPMKPNSEASLDSMESSTCSCSHRSTGEGTPEKRVAKARLFEICTANSWKPPLFVCCEEKGPSHAKMFTFKVIVEMEGGRTVLECYGNPETRKKIAAEHAAEGALWYLKHLGYN